VITFKGFTQTPHSSNQTKDPFSFAPMRLLVQYEEKEFPSSLFQESFDQS